MKEKPRRFAPLWMVLALLAALLPGTGAASGNGAYFTAANEQLMDLNAETMPFYSNGVLYVSSRVFEGGEVGLSYGRNTTLGLATLYRQGSNLDLRFDLAGQVAYDKQGNFYDGYAVEKGGVVFFPLKLVCRYFGLTWSQTETDIAPLIRVKSGSVILNDSDFISAATNLMTLRYDEYLRTQSSRPSQPGTATTPEPPVQEEPPVQAAEGQKVYLVFDGRDARDILPALDGAHATFLLTVEEMEDGDLLRALVGSGHEIALRVLSSTAEDAAEELRQGRDALWQAACCWLELAWYDGEADISGTLSSQGFLLVSAELDLGGGALELLRAIGRHREDVAAYLGGSGCLPALPEVLESLEEGRYRLSAWRLTA